MTGLRSLGSDWLRARPGTERWLGPSPRDPDHLKARVAEVVDRTPCAHRVLAALHSESVNQRPAAQRSLQALEEGAVAVVSGQQAGFLLGPLYTLHKAWSAVACARHVTATTGRPCVPIFWLQDEDHDFHEVASYQEPGGYVATVRNDRARVAIGDRLLSSDAYRAVEQARGAYVAGPFAEEAEQLLAPWTESKAWSQAFLESARTLCEDLPLLFLRGRSAELAIEAGELYRRALRDWDAIEERLADAGAHLEAQGYRVQVQLRRACALCFYHPQGVGGPRYRPQWRGEAWHWPTSEVSLSTEDILRAFDAEPLRLSTSALLRPLVQDTLLPVVTQLIGPGEASYLAQLRALRDYLNVPTPLFAPRGQAMWIEAPTRRRLEAIGLTSARSALDAPPEALLAERASTHPELSPERLYASLVEPLERGFAALGGLPAELDRSRSKTLASTRAHLARFVGRAARFRARSDADTAERLARIRNQLLPGGQPQERTMGVIGLVARHGVARLREVFEASYVPFASERMELKP